MAEVQDEEQWLYGDDKDEPQADKKITKSTDVSQATTEPFIIKSEPQSGVTEQNGEAQNLKETPKAEELSQEPVREQEDEEESSDDDDEPTVTIGKIVKQPDIVRPPPPPTHRAAPTSGLKDDDFSSVGKINGVAAPEFNLAELEDKPWRKPGADIADYFNYGFTEETWIKYCERQKAMRVHESGVGLGNLGVNIGRFAVGGATVSGPIMNANLNYNQKRVDPRDANGMDNPNINTIQVMTADRRIYSNKSFNQNPDQPSFDAMDFGVGGSYGGQDFFNTPPPTNFFNTPPPPGNWNRPPPAIPQPRWIDPLAAPPPILPPQDVPASRSYYDEENAPPEFRSHSRERDPDSRERDRSRERESRRHRRRSRSRSRHRRRSRSRSRSKSRTPTKHKRKKSKRDRNE